MCSPVEHYVYFYLISFLYEIEEDVPQKKLHPGKVDVPQKKLHPGKVDVPRKSGLSSLYYCFLCPPLCRTHCLSFRLKRSHMATLLEKS